MTHINTECVTTKLPEGVQTDQQGSGLYLLFSGLDYEGLPGADGCDGVFTSLDAAKERLGAVKRGCWAEIAEVREGQLVTTWEWRHAPRDLGGPIGWVPTTEGTQ
jgi:hypothetical protein